MKRDMLEVVDARPPNFDEIVKALPHAADPGVMFAYGDKVYFPGGKGPLTRELDAHERVHLDRQDKIGVTEWWRDYLTSPEFRYVEELLAHRAEYQTYCKRHINPVKRSQFLRQVARRLASPLYAAGVPLDRVEQDILRYDRYASDGGRCPQAHAKEPNKPIILDNQLDLFGEK